jgi:PAS domain-containing protein
VAIHDGEGKREGYVSVITDISERLAIERRRSDAADYLQAITNSVGDGLFASTPAAESRSSTIPPRACSAGRASSSRGP